MSPGKKSQKQRVTIKDIATMANISIGTVDRVLHNRGEVNQETRKRIMAIVKELGYTPNLVAKSLSLKKSLTIAVLIPNAAENNPYWNKPVEGFTMAETELNDFNTEISLFKYDLGRESSFIKESERMLKLNPQGIVMAPHFHNAAISFVRKCKEMNIPVIYVDNNLEEEPGLAFFGQDAFQSGKVAAKFMHKNIEDSSKVLIINLAPNKAVTHHMQRRERGFIDYLQNEIPDRKIRTLSVEIDLSDESGFSDILREVLLKNPDIRGVFVTNSRAYKVAKYFSSTGKGTIMLFGYDAVEDNIYYLKKGTIDLLICQRPQDQGYMSVMAMFNFLLTSKQIEKINYSPIDIIVKENINYYKNNSS